MLRKHDCKKGSLLILMHSPHSSFILPPPPSVLQPAKTFQVDLEIRWWETFFSSTFLFQAAESWRLLTPAASYPTPVQTARVCLKGDQLQLQELISLVIFVKDTFGNKLQSFKIFLIFCNTKKTWKTQNAFLKRFPNSIEFYHMMMFSSTFLSL